MWGVPVQNHFIFITLLFCNSVSTVKKKKKDGGEEISLERIQGPHTDKFKAFYQEVLHKVLSVYSECQENCEILIIILWKGPFFKMTVHKKYTFDVEVSQTRIYICVGGDFEWDYTCWQVLWGFLVTHRFCPKAQALHVIWTVVEIELCVGKRNLSQKSVKRFFFYFFILFYIYF